MSAAIRIRQQGERVRVYQGHLNDRLVAHGGKAIKIDGKCGPKTIEHSAFAAWFLGAMDSTVETIQGGTIPPGAQKIVVDPTARAEAQRQRAKQRRGRPMPNGNGNGSGPVKVLTGIDISNHQPNVDWAKVKAAGHSFAFSKVSEGLGSPDRVFGRARWNAMRDAGLVRGVYHFARPQKGRDPRAEAREFLALVDKAGGLKDGDLRPVLDIEAFGAAGRLSAGQTVTWVGGFVKEIKARTGATPIIYTGSFWRDAMGNPLENFGCPLWLAAFVSNPAPFVPKAWAKQGFAIHQHTEKGSTAGVPGNVDLNRIPGGMPALHKLCG